MPKFKDGDTLIVPDGLIVNEYFLHGPFIVREAPSSPNSYKIYPINDFIYNGTIYNSNSPFMWFITNIDSSAILYEPEKPKKAIYNRLKNL